MSHSILNSTKKILQLPEDDTEFDLDIITHINSTFAQLHQLGVGPKVGFSITDETAEWGEFIGSDPRFNMVRTYVFLKVRVLFDPPSSSFHLTAIENEIKQMEWRLTVLETTVLDGGGVSGSSDGVILDGGIVGVTS